MNDWITKRRPRSGPRKVAAVLAVFLCFGLGLGSAQALAEEGELLLAEEAEPWLLAEASPPAVSELTPVAATIRVPEPTTDEERLHSLQLEVGKTAILVPEFAVKRVSVGNPKILDVVVLSPREVQLVPSAIGSTNVILWGKGRLPAAVIDISVGSSYAHIERTLRSVLKTDDIFVESAGRSIILTGSVASPVQVERAMAIANAFFSQRGAGGGGGRSGSRVVNALEVGGKQQVMLEVVIAEMSRSMARRLTVNWNTVFGHASKFGLTSLLGGLVSIDNDSPNTLFVDPRASLVGTFLNESSGFSATAIVDFAKENGLVKVLAKPTLLARSGQKASFLAGGEVPIPVAQGGAFGSITVEFKQFGVGVEFAPTVLGPNHIHLEVAPEVSEPDFSLGTFVGGAATPGFITRRASTSVDLADGQSFAIAGLLSSQVNQTVEKYPWFGDLPILGVLFRSTSFQRQETELVILVTPRIVKPLPDGPPRLPTDAFVEPNDFEFYLLGAMEAQRGPGSADASDGSASLIGPAGHRVPIAMEGSHR